MLAKIIKMAQQNFAPLHFGSGEVWLVGAGPGDPGLLTLYALQALQQADYILYDALVSEACLAYGRKEAIFEFVGKRAGKNSIKQSDLTIRMINLARKGFRVLRFKGGDPCFFGRGAEEALALQEAEIPYRIIPGITAGMAGPIYAGLTLTYRQMNQNILFLTGHDAKGNLPDFHWAAIAKAAPILVFYMALRFKKEIAKALLEAGRDVNEQMFFISKATTPEQKIYQFTLGEVAFGLENQDFKAPMLLIIGPSFPSLLKGKQVWGSLQ